MVWPRTWDRTCPPHHPPVVSKLISRTHFNRRVLLIAIVLVDCLLPLTSATAVLILALAAPCSYCALLLLRLLPLRPTLAALIRCMLLVAAALFCILITAIDWCFRRCVNWWSRLCLRPTLARLFSAIAIVYSWIAALESLSIPYPEQNMYPKPHLNHSKSIYLE